MYYKGLSILQNMDIENKSSQNTFCVRYTLKTHFISLFEKLKNEDRYLYRQDLSELKSLRREYTCSDLSYIHCW